MTIDSESWTCRGCGGQFIGHRPVDDTCPGCVAIQVTTEPPASPIRIRGRVHTSASMEKPRFSGARPNSRRDGALGEVLLGDDFDSMVVCYSAAEAKEIGEAFLELASQLQGIETALESAEGGE
jgi:hypothetical protein